MKQNFEIVVIGAGHAGCEAALATARMGVPTLLVTMDPLKAGEMSCNPSIGGVGKGQLVRELDAIGGEMGKNADFTGIQFKRLNTRKGSAVQSSRCQSDKKKYAQRMQATLSAQENLQVHCGEVKELLVENGKIEGVRLASGEVGARAVVITAGTFMRGLIHCGSEQSAGGRFGEKPSMGLSDDLRRLGFQISRLKTGTPPRLLAGSIDFSKMERQDGDTPPKKFSHWDSQIALPQVPCYLTFTNEKTHDAIRANLNRSPLYSGIIKGIGPRYCPSIEDKVVKFPQKSRHQLFFEPEGLDTDWIYPNGISTSLPQDVQKAFVRTVPGCQNVVFARYGYAVEYDCIDPRQLKPTLEARHVEGLFLAGQVNGTSGYEEAAAQGLVAGLNAGLKVQERPPVIFSRAESYIGVMIDDLTTLGVNEPYRMFTSRAEYRLAVREDNADLRLSSIGVSAGLLTQKHYEQTIERRKEMDLAKEWLSREYFAPNPSLESAFVALGVSQPRASTSLLQLLKRPEIGWDDLERFVPSMYFVRPENRETLEIEVKYEGYISIQREEVARLKRFQTLNIPHELDFGSVSGLSVEVREKLSRQRPSNLAEAARISGITPSALSAILFHLRQRANA